MGLTSGASLIFIHGVSELLPGELLSDQIQVQAPAQDSAFTWMRRRGRRRYEFKCEQYRIFIVLAEFNRR